MRPAFIVFLLLIGVSSSSHAGLRDFCSSLLKNLFPGRNLSSTVFIPLPKESRRTSLQQLEYDVNLALAVRERVNDLNLEVLTTSVPQSGEQGQMGHEFKQFTEWLRRDQSLPSDYSFQRIPWPLKVCARLPGLNTDLSLDLDLCFAPLTRKSRRAPVDSWVVFESSSLAYGLGIPLRKLNLSSVEAQLPLWSFEFSSDGEIQFSLRRERSLKGSEVEPGRLQSWNKLSTWGVIEIHGAKNRAQSIEAGLFLLEKTALFMRERAEGRDPHL